MTDEPGPARVQRGDGSKTAGGVRPARGRGTRLVKAHHYFAERAREWLQADDQQLSARAGAVERAVRELMQMVVIDLTADENAQEIFETLNARGAQLTAADLIKNFVFQRLTESGFDVEAAYERYWKDFEHGFWEAEINAGRLHHQRSSILSQWLIAKTGEEILAREVFYRFKSYAVDAGASMADLLAQVHRAAQVYYRFMRLVTADRVHRPPGPVRVQDRGDGERGHQAAPVVPARPR